MTAAIDTAYLKKLVRDIPDFPKKGILFKDITTVLQDGKAFRSIVDAVADHYRAANVAHVVCIEARGFVLGSAVAYALGCGLVPVRKKGKLPWKTFEASYELEYGTDHLQIHCDGVAKNEKVLIVDDLLATGGTVGAVVKLMERCGADIAGLAFFIELSFLGGRAKLDSHPIYSVIQY